MTALSRGDRMLKVDHAGEHGAVNIYRGQLLMARWTAPRMLDELREFRSHEQRHRGLFANELRRRGVARCRSYLLCGLGGWLLGLVTGALGRNAIAATTVAVERVVLRHLQEQVETLRDRDPAAVSVISAIVAEEREHHDRSIAHLEANGFWSKLLTPVVAASTESVIRLGMRL